jgi:hypothetical protein
MTHARSSLRRRVAPERPAGEAQRSQAAGAAHAQSVGNRGMQRLLNTAPAAGSRFHLGAADDPLEHEADRVAEQVVTGVGGRGSPALRSAGAPGGAGEAGAVPASVDHALAGPGQPLAPALQDDMGRRFGHDFLRRARACGPAGCAVGARDRRTRLHVRPGHRVRRRAVRTRHRPGPPAAGPRTGAHRAAGKPTVAAGPAHPARPGHRAHGAQPRRSGAHRPADARRPAARCRGLHRCSGDFGGARRAGHPARAGDRRRGLRQRGDPLPGQLRAHPGRPGGGGHRGPTGAGDQRGG